MNGPVNSKNISKPLTTRRGFINKKDLAKLIKKSRLIRVHSLIPIAQLGCYQTGVALGDVS